MISKLEQYLFIAYGDIHMLSGFLLLYVYGFSLLMKIGFVCYSSRLCSIWIGSTGSDSIYSAIDFELYYSVQNQQ